MPSYADVIEMNYIQEPELLQQRQFLFIISAIAGILLKPQEFYFFQYNSCRDTEKFRYFLRQ